MSSHDLAVATLSEVRQSEVTPPVVRPPDAAHDFDFLFGRWEIQNQRLRERLNRSDEWDHFDAVADCRPVLGGAGNVENFQTDWGTGFRGMAVRLFDAQAQRWSIYWTGSGTGTFDAPVIGRFKHAVGDFFGPEQHRGTTVLSRYRWSHIEARSATWDQAWSTDEGRSWETNWIMRFTRTGN